MPWEVAEHEEVARKFHVLVSLRANVTDVHNGGAWLHIEAEIDGTISSLRHWFPYHMLHKLAEKIADLPEE